jgi:hypothetical protein
LTFIIRRIEYIKVKIMVKVTPCHTCAGTEGRQRYYSNPFEISMLEWGGWSAPCPSSFTPWYLPYRRLGGPWGLVWMGMENLASTGI